MEFFKDCLLEAAYQESSLGSFASLPVTPPKAVWFGAYAEYRWALDRGTWWVSKCNGGY